MSGGLTIAIADLYVGTPRPLGDEGLGITSAIHKLRVDPDTSLRLDRINLAGDDQADRSVHGGPTKRSTPTQMSTVRRGRPNSLSLIS